MDELKTKIDLKVLTDSEIKEHCLLPEDLWMVQIPGEQALGPFHTHDLKNYSNKYQYLFEKAQVYSLDTDEWKDMFSVSKFQRRRPQLVSAHNLMEAQEFYILFKGQKNGPHTQEKVQNLLDEQQIKTTTQISLDKGKSWIKLYEYHAFDRRNKKTSGELPIKPEEHFLKPVEVTEEGILESKVTNQMLDELSLMRKRSPSSKKVSSKKTKDSKEPKAAKKYKASRGKSGWKYGMSASLVIVFAVMLFNSKKQIDFSRFQAEVPTSMRSINNSERTPTKRVPASVTPVKKVLKKKFVKKKNTIKRYRPVKKKVAFKKNFPPKRLEENFEEDVENIDIDDPEIQEELSRQIANQEDEQEYYDDEENRDFESTNIDSEQYNDEEEELLPDDERNFNPEDRISHDAE